MEKNKPPSERIIDKYLVRLNEVHVNEITITFGNKELKEFGLGKTKSRAD